MKKVARIGILALLLANIESIPLQAVDDVAGTLFTLTTSSTAPNGAWSWFEDERAIIDWSDPDNPLLLAGSVSSAPNGNLESGDIDLLWRNLNTGVQGEFELHDRLERDDHDSAALYLRPDGRYLAMYSRHIGDNLTRWRISTDPHDPTSWGPVQTLNNGAGTTYNNIYHLENDNNGAGRTYNFTRAVGFDPMVQISGDHGTTWSNVGMLLTQGDGGDRPYVRYASDGKKIHFISTEEHPRDFANSVYHGYVQDGKLYNSDGTVIDNNLFDSSALSPTALTPIFKNGSSSNGTTMNRAWTISLETDNTGNPAGIFSTRANDSSSDHRFFYSRFDGDKWHVNEFAKAGGFLYAAENDYTGLASIDPNNPNMVVVSSRIDPRSETTTSRYELYKGVTSDFGESWSWSAITENSTVDNLRPLIPEWNGQNTALTWMRGTYSAYTDWTTEIVGISFIDSDPKALLWRGDGVDPDKWDVDATNNWDSGGGVTDSYNNGDEVAFDDTASSYQVRLDAPMSPMGVAFNNSSMPYTLAGSGITGNGGLRVIGGGSVTLANGVNAYTGDTLIARGNLALSGATSLSSTPSIYVRSNGTFDVSTLTSGSFTLDAQSLIVDGHSVGDIHAINNSVVQLNSSGIHQGDLITNQTHLSGEGKISGNLTAEVGTIIRVGGVGFNLQPTLSSAVYYDATSGVSGNTSFANGTLFNPPLNGTTGADNAWEQRTAVGSHNNIFESGGEAVENAPTLKTTLPGLAPGTSYQVSVLFWDANGEVEDWNIRAGFATNELVFFANGATGDAMQLNATGAALASSLAYSAAPTLFTQDNRTLLAGNVGTVVVNASGRIEVFLDDMPSPIGANNRTWYDGLAIQQVSFTTGLVVSLQVDGDYAQQSGAELELDIHSPDTLDRLEVSGHFAAGGTLAVSLIAGAAMPQVGDAFDILDFDTFSGEFDAYDLPVLETGLAWNISNLATTGELEIVRDTDLDDDGDVDGRDFLLIQRLNPALIPDWQALYGGQMITPLMAFSAIVPEPATYSLICLASATSSVMRMRIFFQLAE